MIVNVCGASSSSSAVSIGLVWSKQLISLLVVVASTSVATSHASSRVLLPTTCQLAAVSLFTIRYEPGRDGSKITARLPPLLCACVRACAGMSVWVYVRSCASEGARAGPHNTPQLKRLSLKQGTEAILHQQPILRLGGTCSGLHTKRECAGRGGVRYKKQSGSCSHRESDSDSDSDSDVTVTTCNTSYYSTLVASPASIIALNTSARVRELRTESFSDTLVAAFFPGVPAPPADVGVAVVATTSSRHLRRDASNHELGRKRAVEV